LPHMVVKKAPLVVRQPEVKLDGDVSLDVDGGVRVDEDREDGVGVTGHRAGAGAKARSRRKPTRWRSP